MALMELKEYLENIKSESFSGCYIFAGEEDFLKRYYLSSLSSAVVPDKTFEPFNRIVYDGPEVDFGALGDAVKAPPMMSEYKIVEWRYADFSKMSERELKALEALADMHEDYPYTVIAFVSLADSFDFGTPKKKSKLLSRLEERFSILRFDRSADKQLYAWLKRHFEANGVSVGQTTEVVSAMVDRCGHSMDVLKNEVDKLVCYVKSRGKSAVDTEDIEAVCSSVPESDTYAFSNAITDRNRQKAFAALEEMKLRRVDHIIIFSMAQRTYAELFDVAMLLDEGRSVKDIEGLLKMSPYKLKVYANAMKKHTTARLCAAIEALSRADVASKSGGVGGYTAVELFLSEHI